MTDYKKLVDDLEKCTKQELVEKLTLKSAELLTCEKEVDRLNEYVQIMELERGDRRKNLNGTVSQGCLQIYIVKTLKKYLRKV
jgi:hypothetical protein